MTPESFVSMAIAAHRFFFKESRNYMEGSSKWRFYTGFIPAYLRFMRLSLKDFTNWPHHPESTEKTATGIAALFAKESSDLKTRILERLPENKSFGAEYCGVGYNKAIEDMRKIITEA